MSATITIGVASVEQNVTQQGPLVPSQNFTTITLTSDVDALNTQLAKVYYTKSGTSVTLVNTIDGTAAANAAGDGATILAAINAALFNSAVYGVSQTSAAAALFNTVLASEIAATFPTEFADAEAVKSTLGLSASSIESRLTVASTDATNLFKDVIASINAATIPDAAADTTTDITGYSGNLFNNLILATALGDVSRDSVVGTDGTNDVYSIQFNTATSSTVFDRIVFFQAFRGRLSFNQDNADPDSLSRAFGPASTSALSSMTLEELNSYHWARVVLQLERVTVA